jgi:DNA-binding MarR family transcriptional regulator
MTVWESVVNLIADSCNYIPFSAGTRNSRKLSAEQARPLILAHFEEQIFSANSVAKELSITGSAVGSILKRMVATGLITVVPGHKPKMYSVAKAQA